MNASAATVSQCREGIQAALSAAGGVYATYGCRTVSWDDVSRGGVGGSLSCWGANITDTYLKGKRGESLFTVRSNNWNEKLGVVRAADVALLVGNCDESDGRAARAAHGGSARFALRNVTLEDFLRQPAELGAEYAGVETGVNLGDEKADRKVSIRFQTVFLPVEDEGEDGKSTFQFATEAYNYNTTDDSNPRNLVLLATTQGLSVQQDGAGAKRLLLHARDGADVSEYWLEAESSRHKVGKQQLETAAEREDALQRGKATSETIGIRAMGKRFNVLMTIQVPLLQEKKEAERMFDAYGVSKGFGGGWGSKTVGCTGSGPGFAPAAPSGGMNPAVSSFGGAAPGGNWASSSLFSAPGAGGGAPAVCFSSSGSAASAPAMGGCEGAGFSFGGAGSGEKFGSAGLFNGVGAIPMASLAPPPVEKPLPPVPAGGFQKEVLEIDGMGGSQDDEFVEAKSSLIMPKCKKSSVGMRRRGAAPVPRPQARAGRASAARVSRGDRVGRNKGLSVAKPKRNASEHVTVTCVFYATVAGGIPSPEDVIAAVTDMEAMYDACTEKGRLADAAFNFMKSELTVETMQGIAKKVFTPGQNASSSE